MPRNQDKLLEIYLEDGREDEGYREFAYPDVLTPFYRRWKHLPWGFKSGRELLNLTGEPESKGYPWTVGYGYTHGVTPDSRLSRAEAEHHLKEVILESIRDAEVLVPNFEDQPDAIKTVLVNMAYNMGRKTLSTFKNTLRYCKEKNYPAMAAGMEKSLWYRQVGKRAVKLVKRVRTLTIE